MTAFAKHYAVTGKVQGVSFRAFAKREAEVLGIKGYAMNLTDGSVEILAIGPAEALERFETRLRQGPPFAKVEGLQAHVLAEAGTYPGFSIRY